MAGVKIHVGHVWCVYILNSGVRFARSGGVHLARYRPDIRTKGFCRTYGYPYLLIEGVPPLQTETKHLWCLFLKAVGETGVRYNALENIHVRI